MSGECQGCGGTGGACYCNEADTARELAEAHWDYTGKVILKANPAITQYELIKYLYVQAFIHGWKHKEESK
jgi:hypothetical protein